MYYYTYFILGIIDLCLVAFVGICEFFSFIPFTLCFLQVGYIHSSFFHCIDQLHAFIWKSSYIPSSKSDRPLLDRLLYLHSFKWVNPYLRSTATRRRCNMSLLVGNALRIHGLVTKFYTSCQPDASLLFFGLGTGS